MIDHRVIGERAKPRRRPMRQRFRLAALEALDVGRREGLNVVEMTEEIPAPEAAPIFTVCHCFETKRRLFSDRPADRLVLNRLEIRYTDLATLAFSAGLLDFLRAQQAANMFGSERRLSLSSFRFRRS